jgi:predicted TIM-barrel fold metal-dependent hydrolase
MAATSPDPASAVIEPNLAIIDSHHHLWLHPHRRYLIDEFAADLASGHNVLATVYVECSAMHRKSGPDALRPVGEAEFVAGMAAMSESGNFGPTRICAAFVGAADLTLGDAVDVLDALAVASGRRLRGIRGVAIWDADPLVNTGSRPFAPRGLLMDSRFRAGFSRLVARKLVYDAFQYHPQLPELCSLADAFPDATIVVNHCGGLLGIGRYAGPDTSARWKAGRRSSRIRRGGQTCHETRGSCSKTLRLCVRETVEARYGRGPRSDMAPLHRDVHRELFGPSRCMFESNFPPDNIGGSYSAIWNCFKLIASACSAAEKRELFSGTAARIYGIN